MGIVANNSFMDIVKIIETSRACGNLPAGNIRFWGMRS